MEGEGESWQRGCADVIEREKTLCCTRVGGAKGETGGCSRETVVEKEEKEEKKEEEDGVEESRRRRGGERHSRRRRRRWFSWETKERERRKISSRGEVAGLKAPFSSPRRVTRSWRLLPRRAATTASHRIYKSVWSRVRFLILLSYYPEVKR